MQRDISLFENLIRLYNHVPPRRKRQLYYLLALMLISGLAELISLGAVLPFLTLLTSPSSSQVSSKFESLLSLFGAEHRAFLLFATIGFAVAAFLAGAIRLLLSWNSQKVAFMLGTDLSVEIYRHTLHQPYLYHVSRNTSEVVASVNKIDVVTTGVLLQFLQATAAAIIAIFIVVTLIVIDSKIALTAALAFGITYTLVSYLTRIRMRTNSRTWSAAQAERVKALQEGLGGIREVLIDQSQSGFIERYAQVDSSLRMVQANSAFIATAPRYILEAFGVILIAGMALMLSTTPGGLAAALPILGALALGAQRLLPLLQTIYNGSAYILAYQHALADINEILTLPITPRSRSDIAPLPFKHEIVLMNVSFKYTSALRPAVKAASFSIAKGERIGIVGKTGSGKSTIVDLIMGLLKPTCGEIRIDDMSLDEQNMSAWHRQIAHVPQAIYLADTSVASNIGFGIPKDKIDMARVFEAARRAKLADFVDGLPAQYETIVGEHGIRLSGGQRQRIGIARALYKNASVLILDEATSALDNETENEVMQAIDALGRDITILVIAHRTSTVANCDKVIIVEDGSVRERINLG